MSYCIFFPGLVVGPTFSYEMFLDFINLNGNYRNIKYSLRNILKPLAVGAILGVITAYIMPVFDSAWVLRSETYQSYSVFGKLLAINIIGFFYRIKFYTAWYLVQSTINISGLTYSLNGNND